MALIVVLATLAVVDRRAALLVLGLNLLALAAAAIFLSRRDAQTILTIVVVVLFLVPENYVLVGPLRSVGNPAQLIGIAALGFWLAGRVLGLIAASRWHPIRWAILAFVITSLTAFAAGMTRILSVEEMSGATRSLFPLAAALGIGLLACDGLRTRGQVETVLRRLVWVGGLAAVIGIIAFAFPSFDYRTLMHLPGLTTTTELIDDTRSGFSRITAAAAHPIEYAVSLAALAPLALHYALYAPKSGQRQLSGLSLVLILVVNPMTVSRSGLLALAVGLGLYAVQLSNRARVNLIVLGAIGLVLFRAAVPGLLGTIKSLFLAGEDDPSIAGRTEDYAKIPGLIQGHIWFGRGLGTFQPLEYFYLDNQYLGTLLEGGLIGLAALIALFLIGMGVARGIRHRSDDPALRGLGQALAACIGAFAVSALTFDEFGFRQCSFTIFLLLGCAGALWTQLRDQPKRTRRGELKVNVLATVDR